MEKQKLKEIIVKAVGLGVEHIDEVFDSFIKKVAEVLQINQTIKIEDIGYFQLRVEPVSRLDRDDLIKSKEILVFKNIDSEDRLTYGSPFLTFEIESDDLSKSKFSESVFNLSIDQPSTIMDEPDTDEAVQSKDNLDESIQEYVKQLIASGIILDGYELLGLGPTEKIDADETRSSDIIKEVSSSEPIDTILESEEPLHKTSEDEIEKNEMSTEEDLTKSDFQFNETKSEIDSSFETEEKTAVVPDSKYSNPFDELNDLINEEKDPSANESIDSQAMYDEAKGSTRTEKKSNKLLIISIFATVFVILLIAILYFTASPTETPTRMQTYVEKPKENQRDELDKAEKVDSTDSDRVAGKETSSVVPVLKEKVKEPVVKPKPTVKTNYSGLYRKISKDVGITDRIYYDGKKYMVQISSWKSKTIAEHEVNRLKRSGFDAFIYRVYIKSKDGTWNRVRIGYFDSKNEAAEFLKRNKL